MNQDGKPTIANKLVEVLRRDLPQFFPQLIAADPKGENRVLLTTGLKGQLLVICNDLDDFEVTELDYASRPGPSVHCDKKALGSEIMAWGIRNGANA